MSAVQVNTAEAVRVLVDTVAKATPKPFIFVDLEGINLSRHGSISIMQLLIPPNPVVKLIDVRSLHKSAFETSGDEGCTLRSLLESEEYPKVFFDVRNDSDALFSHYQIKLHCVIDLQLLEFAARSASGGFVNGLARCISKDGQLSAMQHQDWLRSKEAGQRLFAPEKGGRYEVFNERPLSRELQDYCAQDVLMLPKLLETYARRVPPHLGAQIHAETLQRIALSQSPHFNGKGRHMAVGPSFKRNKSSSTETVECPLNIVFSADLGKYCTLNETSARTEQDNAMSAVPESTTREVTTTTRKDSPSALLRDLESLQVDETGAGEMDGRVDLEDNDQLFESHSYTANQD